MKRASLNKILLSLAAVTFNTYCSAVIAMGLQVSPMAIEMSKTENAKELWLLNAGSSAMHTQVRAFAWDQENNKNTLVKTQELIISPPIANIPPGGRQLVRVIKKDSLKNDNTFSAYRIMINEIPVSSEKQTGVDFVMEYSVPVFINSVSTVSNEHETYAVSLSRERNDYSITLNNNGENFAKIYNLTYKNKNGGVVDVVPGLLGYVLPGRTMTWSFSSSLITNSSRGGVFEYFINGNRYSKQF